MKLWGFYGSPIAAATETEFEKYSMLVLCISVVEAVEGLSLLWAGI